ncbi:twin-arginine translocation pathway signal [Mycobacterium sp. E796]|nr:twin-arginine translocation pathway signal [Mycobacterium sp. E796]
MAEQDCSDTAVGDEETPADQTIDARRNWIRRALSRWPLIVIGLLLVAAAAVTAGLYFGQYRHDQQANDTTAKSAITAASEGTVAILSYTPDKLESDLAAAKSHLTGDFLTYYGKFTDQIVAPAAKTKAVTTQATVKRAVITELHPDSARVLVFLDQTTTSKDAPGPVQTASSVVVSLTKVHDKWLISAFDPI